MHSLLLEQFDFELNLDELSMQEMLYHESLRRLELLHYKRYAERERSAIIRHERNIWKPKDIKRKYVRVSNKPKISYKNENMNNIILSISNICDSILNGTSAMINEYDQINGI